MRVLLLDEIEEYFGSWITTPCENFASGSMWNALIESSGYHPNS